MTYSAQVKSEICRVRPRKTAEALAEAYGVMLFCRNFSAEGLRIVTQSEAVAEFLPFLFKKAFGVTFDRMPEAGHVGRFVFEIREPSKLYVLMDGCGYDGQSAIAHHINFGVLEDNELRAAFLRGAFLAGGSVTDPTKSYHLELSTGHYAVSRELPSVLGELKLNGRTTLRKGNYVTYFKQSGEISDALTAMGAPVAAMEVINATLDKTVINKANRRWNCDMANVDKVVAASRGQLSAIRQIRETVGLDALPDKLKEAARLRWDNPELSLTQLAEMCDPPVTKATFNYRLKKLMDYVHTGES